MIMTIKHRSIGERNDPSETVVQDKDCVYVFFILSLFIGLNVIPLLSLVLTFTNNAVEYE